MPARRTRPRPPVVAPVSGAVALHVDGVPVRPSGWQATVTMDVPDARILPQAMPRTALALGTIAWAAAPRHPRVDAYHLSPDRSRRRWLLWLVPFEAGVETGAYGEPLMVAHAPRAGLEAPVAARLLLLDFWCWERDDGTEPFTAVRDGALLGAVELERLRDLVWDDA